MFYPKFLCFYPLNAELNSICHLMALLGAHLILRVSRIRVKSLAMDALLLQLDRKCVGSDFCKMYNNILMVVGQFYISSCFVMKTSKALDRRHVTFGTDIHHNFALSTTRYFYLRITFMAVVKITTYSKILRK
jgi:hypothetical protein